MGIERQMESATRVENPYHAVEVGTAGFLLLPTAIAAFAAASNDARGLWERGDSVAWIAGAAGVVVLAIAAILRYEAGRALESERNRTTRRAVTEASPALRALGSLTVAALGTLVTAMGVASASVDYDGMGRRNMTRGLGLAFMMISVGAVMIVGGAVLLSRAVFGVHVVPAPVQPVATRRAPATATARPVVVTIDGRRATSYDAMLLELFTALGWPYPEARSLGDLGTALAMPGARPVQLVWQAHQLSRAAMGVDRFGDLLRQLNQVSQQSFLTPHMVAFSFTLA